MTHEHVDSILFIIIIKVKIRNLKKLIIQFQFIHLSDDFVIYK